MLPDIFFISFFLTFILTPLFARYAKSLGIVGIDLHKEEKKEVPEMGGIAIFISIFASLFYYGAFKTLIALNLTEAFGIYDDVTKAKAWQKLGIPFLIGALYFYLAENLGFFKAIAFAFAFMCTVNFTNMLAGFNGLEIGTGAIAMLGIFASAYLLNAELSMVISLVFLASLLAFLYYNKYPAKIFPGDAGTLIIGAAFFLAIYHANLYIQGFIILIPYIVDALLKFISAGIMTRESQKPTIVKHGMLFAPEKSNLSLPRLILKIKPMKEKQLVVTIWLIELFFAFLSLLVTFAIFL